MINNDWDELTHLSSDEICTYIAGEASDALKEWVDIHINECDFCRTFVEAMSTIDKSFTENHFIIPMLTPDEKEQCLINLNERITALSMKSGHIINTNQRKKFIRWPKICLFGILTLSLFISFALGFYVGTSNGFLAKDVNNQISADNPVYAQETNKGVPDHKSVATVDSPVLANLLPPLSFSPKEGTKRALKSISKNNSEDNKIVSLPKEGQAEIKPINKILYRVEDSKEAYTRMLSSRSRGKEMALIQRQDSKGRRYYDVYRGNINSTLILSSKGYNNTQLSRSYHNTPQGQQQ